MSSMLSHIKQTNIWYGVHVSDAIHPEGLSVASWFSRKT